MFFSQVNTTVPNNYHTVALVKCEFGDYLLLFLWGSVCIEGLCWFILFLPGRVYHDQAAYYPDSSPHHHLSGFIKLTTKNAQSEKPATFCLPLSIFFFVCEEFGFTGCFNIGRPKKRLFLGDVVHIFQGGNVLLQMLMS